MKLWVDDLRTPPDDSWLWAKSSRAAIELLEIELHVATLIEDSYEPIEVMSLDHDLGGDDTTRPVVIWMIENDFWPDEVLVHSANPVGIEWLEGMIKRYKP